MPTNLKISTAPASSAVVAGTKFAAISAGEVAEAPTALQIKAYIDSNLDSVVGTVTGDMIVWDNGSGLFVKKTIAQVMASLGVDIFNIELHEVDSSLLVAATYTLMQYASFPFDIIAAIGIVDAGDLDVALKIEGTNVTDISAANFTSSESTHTATGAKSVAVGDTITLVTSGILTAAKFDVTIKCQRT